MAKEDVELGLATIAQVDIDEIIKKFMGCVFDTTDEATLIALADRSKPLPSLVEMIIKISYKVVGVAVEQIINFLKPIVLLNKMAIIDVPIVAALSATPALQTAAAIKLIADIVRDVLEKLKAVLSFIAEFIADPFKFILDKLLAAVKNIKLPIPEIELFPGLKMPKIDNNNEQDSELFKIKLDPKLALKLGLSIDCSFLDIFKKLPSMSVEDIALLPPQFDFFLTAFKMLKDLIMMPVDMLKGFIEGLLELVNKAIGLIPTDPIELLKLPLKVMELVEKIIEYLKKLKPDLDFFKNLVMIVIEPLIKPMMDIPNPGIPIEMLIKQIMKIVGKCIPNLLLEIFVSLLETVFTELAKVFTAQGLPDFAAQKENLKAADANIKKLEEMGVLSKRIYAFLELYAKNVEIPNSNPIEYITEDAKSMKACADLLKENKTPTQINSVWNLGGYSPQDSVVGIAEHDDLVLKIENMIKP